MRQMMIAAAFAAAVAAGLAGCKKEETTPAPAGSNGATTKPAADVSKTVSDIANMATTQPAAAAAAAQAALGDVMGDYQKYTKEATEAIAKFKWDDAEGAIKKLEELQPKLPESAKPGAASAIAALKDTVSKGKAANGGAAPVIPGNLIPGSN